MFSPVRARAYLACGSILTAPLMHAAFVDGRFAVFAIAAGVAQASFAVWLAAARWRTGRWAAAAGAGAAVLWLGLSADRLTIGTWSGMTHAFLFLALLTLFAGSLRPGRTPVVTKIALASRGKLPPELVRYTRNVTVLWAGFAAAQLAGSVLLLIFAPPAIWSFFVNGLDMPSMLILFGAEYTYRRCRFRNLPRLSRSQLRQAVAAYVAVREP